MSEPSRTPFTSRLPIGERLPVPAMVDWDIFPFEGELAVKPLDPPVLPEPPRDGEAGAAECRTCGVPDEDCLWTDDHWRLRATRKATGVPVVVVLEPRDHYDSTDLPIELAAELGVVMQRVERAILSLGGIARVHMSRWGDGGAHLHWWFFARPEGMMQLRGTCLAIWDDILPALPEDEWQARLGAVAAAVALGGGTAQI